MKKLIKMATVVASVGVTLSFAGCGAKGPDAVALDVLQTLQAGKAMPEYLTKNCTEKAMTLFSTFGAMVAENLKGATFTVDNTKIDGDAAVVTIRQNGGAEPGVKEYDLIKVDNEWKLDIDKEKQANRDKQNAEDVVKSCLEAAKKGLVNKASAKKYFYCQGEELDALLYVFDAKSNPDYKKASKEEQEEFDKKIESLEITSSTCNAGDNYVIIGIGTKEVKDAFKLKVTKDADEWKISCYVEE